MKNACQTDETALSLLVDGELQGEEQSHLLEHLGRCPDCSEAHRQLVEIRSLAGSLPDESTPAEIYDEVRRAWLDTAFGEHSRALPQPRLVGRTPRVVWLRPRTLLSAAAGLLLAMGLWQWIVRQEPGTGPGSQPAVDLQRDAEPGSTVSELLQGLGHAHPDVRAASAEGLGLLGPAAASAIPALEALLQDPEPRVREAAAEALQRVRPAAGR
jgi:anti-sigma factor RsiW